MNEEKIQAFLDELTALTLKHGLAINDTGEIWELEPEDADRKYQMDEVSILRFE